MEFDTPFPWVGWEVISAYFRRPPKCRGCLEKVVVHVLPCTSVEDLMAHSVLPHEKASASVAAGFPDCPFPHCLPPVIASLFLPSGPSIARKQASKIGRSIRQCVSEAREFRVESSRPAASHFL